jgi:hypothetical protein
MQALLGAPRKPAPNSCGPWRRRLARPAGAEPGLQGLVQTPGSYRRKHGGWRAGPWLCRLVLQRHSTNC